MHVFILYNIVMEDGVFQINFLDHKKALEHTFTLVLLPIREMNRNFDVFLEDYMTFYIAQNCPL